MRLIHRRTKSAHPSDVLDRTAILLAEFRTASTQQQIVAHTMDLLLELVPADAALLLGYPAEKKKVEILHAHGIWSSFSGDFIERDGIPEGADPVLRTERTPLRETLERAAGTSMCLWNTPLRSRDRILGSLWLGRTFDKMKDFSVEERRVASLIADIAAGGLLQSGLDDRVEKQQSQILAMRSVDRAITSSLDLNVILNVFLDQVTTQLNADATSVLLMDPQNLDFTMVADRGFHTHNRPQSRLRMDHSLASQASLERKMVSLEGAKPEDLSLGNQPLMREEQFTAYYATPLIAHGQVKGVLEVFLRSAGTPDSDWADLLETLALQGAIAIDNSESFLQLQRTRSELALVCDSTIEGWSRAVDLRAREAEGHSQRVFELSVRTAEKMGILPDQILSVRRGALLHDIGKLGIPDRILWKAGALSDEEWQLMRQHPKLAEQLLAPIEFLRLAMDIPKFHHERWDGGGYPYGLSGKDIPLSARIFSVVDVWDSMQARRPFREPWSAPETVDYLIRSSGRQFDPDVVDSFMQILQDSDA